MSPRRAPAPSTIGSFSMRCCHRMSFACSSVVPTRRGDERRPLHHPLDGLVVVFHEPQIAVGEDADELPASVDDRDAADLVASHQHERLADGRVGRKRDGVGDHPALRALHPVDLQHLVFHRQVAVHDADATEARHGDRQWRFGDRVHGRRHDRDVEGDLRREARGRAHLTGQDVRLRRKEQHVVEREAFLGELGRVAGSAGNRALVARKGAGRGLHGESLVSDRERLLPLDARRVPSARARSGRVGRSVPRVGRGPSGAEPRRSWMGSSAPARRRARHTGALRCGDRRPRCRDPARDHALAAPGLARLLPDGRVRAVGARRPRLVRTRRARDALVDVTGLHRAGDAGARLDGRPPRPARAVPFRWRRRRRDRRVRVGRNALRALGRPMANGGRRALRHLVRLHVDPGAQLDREGDADRRVAVPTTFG